MTYLEKLKQDHPSWDEEEIIEGRCPNWDFDVDSPNYCNSDDEDCEKCWNREIPGTETDHLFCMGDKSGGMAVTNKGYEFWQDGEAKIKLEQPAIKDSGERRQFYDADGNPMAVRDIQEGKGRCDLMPLDTVGVLMNEGLFYCLAMFQKHGDALSLEESLNIFREVRQWDKPTMFLEVAKHFEDGAKKYGENNWQKGIPVRCYIDSAVRHYLKYLRGDKDEPHDRAFCWNILCAIWTCKHKPELNEYNKEETEE